jgi:hypothetical protein
VIDWLASVVRALLVTGVAEEDSQGVNPASRPPSRLERPKKGVLYHRAPDSATHEQIGHCDDAQVDGCQADDAVVAELVSDLQTNATEPGITVDQELDFVTRQSVTVR